MAELTEIYGLGYGAKETCFTCGCTLAPPGEYDWTAHVRRRCGLFVEVLRPLFGRPFVKRLALCHQTVVCLSCLSVCDVGVLWPNG